MLGNGAHIKIGDKYFRLAYDQDGAYDYSLTPLSQEVMYWSYKDWSGGEGNDSYDPQDQTVYHQGNTNPRVTGLLTSPPERTSIATASLTPDPTTALGCSAGGRLYIAGQGILANHSNVYYTDDMATFVTVDVDWNAFGLGDEVTAICTDGRAVFLAGTDTAGTGFKILSVDPDLTQADIRDIDVAGKVLAMAAIGDYLYYWNGEILYYRKISGGTAATENTFQLGTSLASMVYKTDYWAGGVVGDGAFYFFTSTQSQTKVFSVDKTGAIGEFWTLPPGFTGKAIAFQAGAVVMAGDYLGNAAAWGMSVVSLQPIFLGYVRYGDTDIALEVAGAGFGSEVLFSERDATGPATIFVYDLGYDAFSELDEITVANGGIHSLGVFQNKRWAAVEDGDVISLYIWDLDNVASASVDGRMETGVWHFDIPEDEKELDGFHVLSDSDGDPKFVDVYYMVDEDSSWVLAGTVDTRLHDYIQVSDETQTVKFHTLRWRVDTRGAAKVYSVSARVRVSSYQETWNLLLDLTDETVDEPTGRRRREFQDRGHQLHAYIKEIATNKDVVEFLDGFPYPIDRAADPDKYDTHLVTVDIPTDRVQRPGEGFMLVRLTSVDTN